MAPTCLYQSVEMIILTFCNSELLLPKLVLNHWARTTTLVGAVLPVQEVAWYDLYRAIADFMASFSAVTARTAWSAWIVPRFDD